MAWIERSAVETLLQTDLYDDEYVAALIDHAQALAESYVGEQDDPDPKLRAVLAQITARMWQAGRSAQMNPAALQSETTGPFTFQNVNAGAAGLGLTNREIVALRRAAGMMSVGSLSTTRGRLDTPDVRDDEYRFETSDIYP
jgi:hypothetical protein